MDNNISEWQGISIIILIISAGALLLPTAREAGADAWLARLIAVGVSIILFSIYASILFHKPGSNMFEIMEKSMGKVISVAIILMFIPYAFLIGAALIRDFALFLFTVSLPETPVAVPTVFMTLLTIWAVKEGLETIGRWSTIFVLFNSPMPTIIVTILIPQMDIHNIFPVLMNGMGPVFEGVLSTTTITMSDTVVLTLFLFRFKEKKAVFRVYLYGLLAAGFMSVGVTLTDILVLGPDIYSSSLFPTFNAATKVDIGNVMQRLEAISILAIITAGFLKISVCLLFCAKSIAWVFGIREYKRIVTPTGLIMCAFSFIIFTNFLDGLDKTLKIYPYIILIFVLIIPLIILIWINLRKRIKGEFIE